MEQNSSVPSEDFLRFNNKFCQLENGISTENVVKSVFLEKGNKMKSLFQVIKENITSLHLIIRLSLFELKSGNRNQYLGMLWEIINPMILISIYWFVFGFGIRGGDPLEMLNTYLGCFPELLFGFLSLNLLYKDRNPSIRESRLSQK